MSSRFWAYAAVLVLLAAAMASIAGCNLGDFIKAKTPNGIQRTQGLPSTLSVNEAESEYQAWYQDVQRLGAEWKANIEQANEIRSLLSQLTLSAMNDVGPVLAGVPVLGPAVPLLTGLGGIFFGLGKLRKEKEASFNKGLKEGKALSQGE